MHHKILLNTVGDVVYKGNILNNVIKLCKGGGAITLNQSGTLYTGIHTCAIINSDTTSNVGNVVCWGGGKTNYWPTGGVGSTSGPLFGQNLIPTTVSSSNYVHEVFVGGLNTCVIISDTLRSAKSVVCWGQNKQGECLGTDTSGNPLLTNPLGEKIKILGNSVQNVKNMSLDSPLDGGWIIF